MEIEKLIRCCEIIRQDVENDIREMDGTPFDGRSVARMFGYHAAAIAALSDVLIKILKDKNNGTTN